QIEIERLVVNDEDARGLQRFPSPDAGASRSPDPASTEPSAQFREQQVLVDRLGHKVVVPRLPGLLLVGAHGMSRDVDHWNGGRGGIALDAPRCFPAVDNW